MAQAEGKLADADPSNAQWQRDLVASHGKLAVLALLSKDSAALKLHRSAALTILDQLEKSGRAAESAERARYRDAIMALGE